VFPTLDRTCRSPLVVTRGTFVVQKWGTSVNRGAWGIRWGGETGMPCFALTEAWWDVSPVVAPSNFIVQQWEPSGDLPVLGTTMGDGGNKDFR